MHGNSNIGTSTAGLGNAGNIELQGNQVNSQKVRSALELKPRDMAATSRFEG
jgi:hypothetical protein